jgi:hypothetical protein
VHQQHRLVVQHDTRGVLDQHAAARPREAPADQEITVTVHQRAGGTALAQRAQRIDHAAMGRGVVIVPDPGVEQVAEDEQSL